MTSPVLTRSSVAVIVCAYTLDRLDDLTACLDALVPQNRRPDDLVCVTDGNADLLDELQRLGAGGRWPGLRVVANDQTPGLSGARNTGVDATDSDIIVFLDDDAVPDTRWLAELTAPFADSDVAGSGGHIEPGWPSSRPWWFPPHLDWTIGCSIPTLPAAGGPIRNMYGASAAFRRSALAAAGGFPTELGRVGANGAGCEETEVCVRIRQRIPGASIVYAPQSHVVHRVSEGRATPRYVLRRCLAEGRSKATLAKRVGPDAATDDERRYVVTIAGAVGADLLRGLRHPRAIGRAVMLVAGLSAASLGYLSGRIRRA